MNHVHLIGNLGQDPETGTTQGGTAFARLSLATNEVFFDSAGNRHENTEWHRVVGFNGTARALGHLRKGERVGIFGKLRTRRWEDEEGNARYTTEVVAREVEFLTPKTRRQDGEAPEAAQADEAAEPAEPAREREPGEN